MNVCRYYLGDVDVANITITDKNTANLISSDTVGQVAHQKRSSGFRAVSGTGLVATITSISTTIAPAVAPAISSVISVTTVATGSSTITHFHN